MNEIRGSIKCFDRLPVRACGQFWFDQACLGKAPLLGAINIGEKVCFLEHLN